LVKPRFTTEHIWWLGIAVWAIAMAFWAPQPAPPFLSAPSASPERSGFAIFHDYVARNTAGARRLLGPPSELPDSVKVLTLLAPSDTVPNADRKKLLEWAGEPGHTLIIGHPIERESGDPEGPFFESTMAQLCSLFTFDDLQQAELDYVATDLDSPREVPLFLHNISHTLIVEECGATDFLLLNELNDVVATSEPWGEGRIIQVSDATLFNNSALGWKQTHLFTAALIDEVGHDGEWAFNEAYEGIHPEPKFVELVGSSRYRAIFLEIVLLIILAYWWRTARIGRPLSAPQSDPVREVASRARDLGDFYYRCGRSRWALLVSLQYLKLNAAKYGPANTAKQASVEIAKIAEEELQKHEENIERHTLLMQKIAQCQRALITQSQGKIR
jgi:hypothetical protein